MSRQPRRACPHPGCAQTTAGGYCRDHADQHARQLDADRRVRRGPRVYDTAAWKLLRIEVLRERPICENCRHRLSREVNHIIDVADAPERALDRSNLQALCKRCHSKHTAKTTRFIRRPRA